MDDDYAGSQRQRRTRRRAQWIAVILAVAMLLPIVGATVAAIGG